MTATPSQTAARNTIGARLARAKKQVFIGRAQECALFADSLAGRREWEILNLCGPGGVGKSSLLDAYRRIAEQQNALYFYFDARDLSDAPESLLFPLASALAAAGLPHAEREEQYFAALHHASAERRIVIAFDTYEDIGGLDRWLRDVFLPQLPEGVIVVIAGRFSLQDCWRDHDAWRELIRPIPLAPFDLEQTREYLACYGVSDEALVRPTWAFTGGHPLALSLAAGLVKQEGPGVLHEAPQRPELISELAQRWLREMPDHSLREHVEAAAVVRSFDQELLGVLTGNPVSNQGFARLVRLSFVRPSQRGWSVHDLMRSAVTRDLQWRRPNIFQSMRLHALRHFARHATAPADPDERMLALEEFFYLLGNGLVRAALYGNADPADSDLRVVPATLQDLPDLNAYMDEWRRVRGEGKLVQLELLDRDTQSRYCEPVVSEPREPDFLNMSELLALGPGVIRLLKAADGSLRGMTVVLPVSRCTLDYLMNQPVIQHYFRRLSPGELAQFTTPHGEVTCWFVRLIDVRDPSDVTARAALLRDLITLLIRPALFITSTPLPLYQDLLQRFGFTRSDCPVHYDFAPDRPAPTFELDLRGPRLAAHLSQLVSEQTGRQEAGSLDDRLVGAVAAELSSWSRLRPPSPLAATPEPDRAAAWLGKLTPREQQVVQAALDGASNATIAARLEISEITVKKHMSRIFEKVRVRNRAQLFKQFWAARAGHEH